MCLKEESIGPSKLHHPSPERSILSYYEAPPTGQQRFFPSAAMICCVTRVDALGPSISRLWLRRLAGLPKSLVQAASAWAPGRSCSKGDQKAS